jgi:hypothetical protein
MFEFPPKLIDELTPHQRAIILLLAYNNWDRKTTASIIGVDRNYIDSTLRDVNINVGTVVLWGIGTY